MRHSSLRPFLVACLATLALPLAAHADGDVKVSLVAHRVVTSPAGVEHLAPADHAKPGDVVEYRARYTNPGHSAVRQMVATLPIPAGMQYVPSTAAPATALASTDGEHFDAIPLRHHVRLANGTDALRDVPYGDYRFLRWTLGDMAAGKSQTVTARVRVESATSVASATTSGSAH